MVCVPIDTGSSGRLSEPIIFFAILNAIAEIVKDGLIPKDVGIISASTT
jgi:hypothetical protein